MLYETERLFLVPFDPESVHGNYRKWMSSPAVTEMNSHGLFPKSEKEINEFVEYATNSKDAIVWNMHLKEKILGYPVYYTPLDDTKDIPLSPVQGKHVGNVSLQSINPTYRSAELAILIGETNCWGKGYGTEACNKVLEHGFLRLGLNRVWSGTASLNIGMQKIFEKIGMKREGVFKDGMFVQGKLVDIYEYAILRKEWDLNKELAESCVALSDKFRQATESDIVKDATVYIYGDDNLLHKMIIENVHNCESEYHTFDASDGCGYGLDVCYVLKEWRRNDRNQIY